MQLALIHDGIVRSEATEADQALGVFDIRDVSKIKDIAPGWFAKADGSYEAPPAVGAPALIPDVSSAQAKIALSRAGFLKPVKASVEAIGGEVEIWFTDARTWQRNNPHVVEIGAGLNLSAEEIDELFRTAAMIDA